MPQEIGALTCDQSISFEPPPWPSDVTRLTRYTVSVDGTTYTVSRGPSQDRIRWQEGQGRSGILAIRLDHRNHMTYVYARGKRVTLRSEGGEWVAVGRGRITEAHRTLLARAPEVFRRVGIELPYWWGSGVRASRTEVRLAESLHAALLQAAAAVPARVLEILEPLRTALAERNEFTEKQGKNLFLFYTARAYVTDQKALVRGDLGAVQRFRRLNGNMPLLRALTKGPEAAKAFLKRAKEWRVEERIELNIRRLEAERARLDAAVQGAEEKLESYLQSSAFAAEMARLSPIGLLVTASRIADAVGDSATAKIFAAHVEKGLRGKGPFAGFVKTLSGVNRGLKVHKYAAEELGKIVAKAMPGAAATGTANTLLQQAASVSVPLTAATTVLSTIEALAKFQQAAATNDPKAMLGAMKGVYDVGSGVASLAGRKSLKEALSRSAAYLGVIERCWDSFEAWVDQTDMQILGKGIEAAGYLMIFAPGVGALFGAVVAAVGAIVTWLGDPPRQNPYEGMMSRLGLIPQE
jgi:hypothetical protein